MVSLKKQKKKKKQLNSGRWNSTEYDSNYII